jgi:hypothetical protein
MMIENKDNLNPHWITGIVDAEGFFNVRFTKSKYHKSG